MDITQLITDDHIEQRRLFALIDQLAPDDSDALKAVWTRLRVLLDTHALAEERFFYPALLRIGRGADDESPVEETRDAIKDHNEIRDTAAKVDEQDLGSPAWFAAVAESNKANSDHMAEEERQGLTDFRRHADLAMRHRLGVQFVHFESEHLTGDGVKPVDRNVDRYVLESS
jgi:Hemerythrin HHE cation binding domain